jgi:two-component system, LytTR family, sensor kinase
VTSVRSDASPTPNRPTHHAWPWLTTALAGGFTVGWLDRSATEVQGPLLLFMAVAFLIAVPRRAPAWAVAIATAAGLPLAHIVGHALGDAQGTSWGMVILLVPATLAAYVGTATGAAMRSVSAALDRRVLIGVVLIGCAVVGTGPVYASLVARGQPFAWWLTTLWQLVSLVAWAVGMPLVLRLWRAVHVADDTAPKPDEVVAHALTAVAIAATHAVLLVLGTLVVHVPLGTSSVANAIGWAFAAYLPLDVLTYVAVAGAAYASNADRRAHAAATREGAVRGELAVAQLAGLRAQLRPHFLFNALNTASVMAGRGDADGTRRVLTGLAELLRYVMRGSDERDAAAANTVPLRDEIAFIEQYLAIERERFPERLRAKVDVAPDLQEVYVPALLLQPLVENAIKHGLGGRIGAGEVVVRAWREGDTLRLSVADDGPGPSSPTDGSAGIGLVNTRARLTVFYGSAATLSLEPGATGGAIVLVTLPLRTIP